MQSGQQIDAAYAVIHELQHFVKQADLRCTAAPEFENIHVFEDGTHLGSAAEAPIDASVSGFITRSARLTEELSSCRKLSAGPSGPSVEGVGLERILIAYELASRYEKQQLPEWVSGKSQWRRDISQILSFFSQMAQRRYEKAAPQMTVAYYPVAATSDIGFGQLGKPVLDEYKALLRLCRDAHTVLFVHRDSWVTGLKSDFGSQANDNFNAPPIPRRLAHLRDLPKKHDVDPVVFNLNVNGSLEIVAQGQLVFRRVNNIWRFVNLAGPLDAISKKLEDVQVHSPGLVAHNFLSLALDLADRGEGALPYLCDEPSTEVLDELFDSREGLIPVLPGAFQELPARARFQELPARARFTRLIGTQRLSLRAAPYDRLSPLLRDLCSIDGATVFSYEGDLLGFGCIVNLASERGSKASLRREGARTAAAKAVSRKGIAIKVSTDGDATLFVQGKEWATFC